MSATPLRVPDLGDFKAVAVIEVLVKAGDTVGKEQPLIVLETDKATMEVPADSAGVIETLTVKVGDRVSAGDVIGTLTMVGAAAGAPAVTAAAPILATAPKSAENADIHTEIVVIGAGPGGYSAAFRAADLGKKVVLIERHESLGGVCLNVGCIPSKALLHAAKVIEDAAFMADHGVKFGQPSIDLPALLQYKASVVGKLTGGLQGLAKRRKVQVLQGVATFATAHRLEITANDGKKTAISFDNAIIATGSRAIKLPFLPDDPRVWDATRALALQDIPPRLLVIGGGVIGVELASVYAALGSAVDIVEATPSLLPGADTDLVKVLHKRMAARCKNLWTATKVTGASASATGIQVQLEGAAAPASASYDAVLVAVGRRPNGKELGLEAVGVIVDERGFIPTDTQLRTNLAHIFAIGDVTRNPMLAHKAVHEGKVAAEVIAGHKAAFEPRGIPSVVYTDPEVAWTGLTETEAKQKGIEVKIGKFPWAANGRSLGMGNSEGFTKILFDAATGRALGGAAVGPGAGELMAEIGLAIEMGADAHDIGLTVHAHPTLSETVAMSAEHAAGTLTDL